MHQAYHRSNPLISFRADDGTPHISPQPSILAEYVLFPIYDYIVTFIPSCITPNQVTLFGILSTLISSLLMLSSMPSGTVFEPPYASWLPTYATDVKKSPLGPLYPTVIKPVLSFMSPQQLLLICGLLNVLYCVADNTDGRLARRDKRSSLIGEYLDHSLDCVTSLLSTGVVFSVMGASTSNMAFSISSIAVATLAAHTYHFECNRFVWGNRIMTVDEAMIFFAVGIWIPLVVPNVAYLLIPIPAAVIELAPCLEGFRLIDVLYFVSFISQLVMLFGLLRQRPGMLLRFQTIAILIVAFVLLSCIPSHCEAAVLRSSVTERPSIASVLTGYSLGPLSYPAVWIITAACSYSALIHMPIVSRCAELPHIDYLFIALVVVTMFLFPATPVAAMIWSVAAHIFQVFCNLRCLIKNKKGKTH